MDIIKVLSIQREDKQKWVKYYQLETYRYYDYILNILPNNNSILEVGSGGGVFYSKHKDILTKRNNKYTCIDIDEPSIEYSKEKCDYVDFFVKDVRDFTDTDFKQYDLLLLVQSYMVIPNVENVIKTYFESKPNGCVMLIYTAFPDILIRPTNLIRNIISNTKMSYGRSISLTEIKNLGTYLGRTITNIHISKSLCGFNEYLTIIR